MISGILRSIERFFEGGGYHYASKKHSQNYVFIFANLTIMSELIRYFAMSIILN